MTKHGTNIEWTHVPGYTGETWIPIAGCSRVNEACRNCYAEQLAGTRLKQVPFYKDTTRPGPDGPLWTGKISLDHDKRLLEPLRLKNPRAFFLTSMGDVFHPDVPDEYIDKLYAVMALCPQHLFIVLTKRPARMREYMTSIDNNEAARLKGMRSALVEGMAQKIWSERNGGEDPSMWLAVHLPLPNVWHLTSVANQAEADALIPPLLDTPSAVRGVSIEPMIGSIDLQEIKNNPEYPDHYINSLRGFVIDGCMSGCEKLDWVIAGGESGKHARPTHPDWIRSIRDQCKAASVPFFFKQWGEWGPEALGMCKSWREDQWHEWDNAAAIRIGKKAAGCTLDGQTHHEWPSPA